MTIERCRFVLRSHRFERLDEPALSAGAEERVLVQALLGPMPEQSLHCLNGLATRNRRAGHRCRPALRWLSKRRPVLPHEPQGPGNVAVDVTQKPLRSARKSSSRKSASSRSSAIFAEHERHITWRNRATPLLSILWRGNSPVSTTTGFGIRIVRLSWSCQSHQVRA